MVILTHRQHCSGSEICSDMIHWFSIEKVVKERQRTDCRNWSLAKSVKLVSVPYSENGIIPRSLLVGAGQLG
jgi:hypothetical protein